MLDKRILVIGGTGHFGAAVVEAIARLDRVTVHTAARKRADVCVDLTSPSTFAAFHDYDFIVNASDSVLAPPDDAMRFALAEGLTWIEMSADPALYARVRDFDAPLASGSVVLGAGLFPGLSTALARATAAECAAPSSLELGIRVSPLSGAGAASCALMAHTLSLRCIRYREGLRQVGGIVGTAREMPFGDDRQVAVEMALPDADLVARSTRAAAVTARVAFVPRPVLGGFRLLAALSAMLGPVRAPLLAFSRQLLFLMRSVLLRKTTTRVDLTAIAVDVEGEVLVRRVSVPDGRLATAAAAAVVVDALRTRTLPTGLSTAGALVRLAPLLEGMQKLGVEVKTFDVPACRDSAFPRPSSSSPPESAPRAPNETAGSVVAAAS